MFTMIIILINQANLIAVKLMDKLECQQLFIEQYLKLTLEKCLQDNPGKSFIRLPLEVYRHCKTIFKKQVQIARLLLELYRRDFFIKRMDLLEKEWESRPDNLYLQILARTSSAVQYEAQIMVRFMMLGLSIRIAKPPSSAYSYRIKQLFRSVQIELEFNSGESSLSEVILNQLKQLSVDFDYLEFYESLLHLFENMTNLKITGWLQTQLAQKRKKFEEKKDVLVSFRMQASNAEQAEYRHKKINKRVTIHGSACNELTLPLNTSANKPLQQIEQPKTQTVTAKKEEPTDGKRQIPLSILQANQRRKSMGRSLKQNTVIKTLSPTKYLFKSIRKSQNTKEEESEKKKKEEFTVQSKENQKITTQNITPKVQKERPKMIHFVAQQEQSSNSNSRMICPATPPRMFTRTQ